MKNDSSMHPRSKEKTTYIGEVREVEVERRIYTVLPKDFNPVMYSFGCPISLEICGQLKEISRGFSSKNVFVAIPYSNYSYENDIKEVLAASALNPKLAKNKILSKVLLCKVCSEFRQCAYGVADISKKNLNVVYELGLMQSIGMKCAILLEEGSERQTDLQGIENVLYKNSMELRSKLAKWIQDNVPTADQNEMRALARKLP